MREGSLLDVKETIRRLLHDDGFRSILQGSPGIRGALDDPKLLAGWRRELAVLESMTRREIHAPALIDASRLERIARGCGASIEAVAQTVRELTRSAAVMRSAAAPPPQQVLATPWDLRMR